MDYLVSIIVPIYNVELYLERCVDSLLNQTYQHYEIILVDDCSTDNSADIAYKYSVKYPNCCFFYQRKINGGLAAARNSGLDLVKGSFITFIDSDDWVREDYLSLLLKTAIKDNADITSGSLCYAFPDGRIKKINNKVSTTSSHKEKVALIRPSACRRLYRTSFFLNSNLRFPENVKRAEDMGLTIPIFTKTNKLSFINEPIYYYRQRNGSLSNSNSKGIDVSFFDIAVNNMITRSEPGFECELEYRAICELMYGKIMIMIRAGYMKHDIIKEITNFTQNYPNWAKNSYLKCLPIAKRLFLYVTNKKLVFILRILIKGWDLFN